MHNLGSNLYEFASFHDPEFPDILPVLKEAWDDNVKLLMVLKSTILPPEGVILVVEKQLFILGVDAYKDASRFRDMLN
jgi:hypothetical protein